MRGIERLRHIGRERDGERGIGAGIVERGGGDAGEGVAPAQRGGGLGAERFGDLGGGGERRLVERQFEVALADGAVVGEAHAIGGEHARERVDQHRLHAQLVGDETGVLPAGTAEADHGEGGGVVPLVERDLLDRRGHVGDGDAQEAFGDRLGIVRAAGCGGDLRGERLELRAHRLAIERLVAAEAEDGGEKARIELAEQHIGVGDGERAATPIAGGAGVGAGAVRPDAEAAAVELEDRSATGRDRGDRHHRHAHLDPGDLGIDRPLERAVVERDIGGGAAHVEADDPIETRGSGGARRADHAAGGAGEDRILALEARGIDQPAARLHERERHRAQLAGDLIDVAA